MMHGGSFQSLTDVESRHSKPQTVKSSLQPRHLHLQLLSLLYDLVPISDPPLLQKDTQDLRSAPG